MAFAPQAPNHPRNSSSHQLPMGCCSTKSSTHKRALPGGLGTHPPSLSGLWHCSPRHPQTNTFSSSNSGWKRRGPGSHPSSPPSPPTVSRRPLPVRRAPVGRAQGSRQGPRRQLDVDGEGLHGDPRSPTAPRPCPAPLAGSAAAAAGPSRPAPPPPCGCRTAVPGLPVCGQRVSVFSRNPEPVPGPEQERAPIFLVPHSQPQRPSRGSPRQCLGDEGRPLKLSVIPMP